MLLSMISLLLNLVNIHLLTYTYIEFESTLFFTYVSDNGFEQSVFHPVNNRSIPFTHQLLLRKRKQTTRNLKST